MIAPQARGLEVPDAAGIPAFMEQIQRNLHLFGRYGITMFAISALDIALWDLAARAKGVPLHRLIGEARRTRIPAYASLLRIGNPDLIARECETALRLGYKAIKLHETTTPAVFAARQAIGAGIPLMVDMNCPMDGEAAIAFAHACRDAAPMFLEEPVWPPEDFATLAEVRTRGGLNIAAGENACTAHQFRQMMKAGAVSHAQPSVIKVGGITEYLKVVALADAVRHQACAAFAVFRARLPGDAAVDVAARRRHLRRGVLHEARGVSLARPHRCRCEWRCRGPAGSGARLRAGQGGHGAIPGVLIPTARLLRALLCRRGILCGRRGSLLRVVSRLALRRLQLGNHLLQADDRALQRLDLPVGWRRSSADCPW